VGSNGPSAHDAERIRAAYARRAESGETDRYLATRPANALAREQREWIVDEALARRDLRLADLDILEVGCGVGSELVRFVARGADPARVSGIDLLPYAIAEAEQRLPAGHFVSGDASRLPYPTDSFGLVYQAMALSSMPSRTMRAQVAAEMARVVRPDGLIVSYDFAWNPINRDTVGIGSRELRRLFPGASIEVHRVTLIPPVARWVGDRSEHALRILSRAPFLRTHRVAMIDVPN